LLLRERDAGERSRCAESARGLEKVTAVHQHLSGCWLSVDGAPAVQARGDAGRRFANSRPLCATAATYFRGRQYASAAKRIMPMSDKPSADSADPLSQIPTLWDEDPTAQLRALRLEVIRQRDSPTPHTHVFMAAVWDSLRRLPEKPFVPEAGLILVSVSRFHFVNGQLDRALAAARTAVEMAVRGPNRNLEIQARLAVASCLRETYELGPSLIELARALEIARAEGDSEWEAKSSHNLAHWYSDAGQHDETVTILERIAPQFEAHGDHLSAWMALDDAASAALRLGDIQRALALSERARAVWRGEATNPLEQMWLADSLLVNCELLIRADRIEEAVERSRSARALSAVSGSAQARALAGIADAIVRFAAGTAGDELINSAIERARGVSLSSYGSALSASIAVYQHAGRADRALTLQRELLALNESRKFDEVRRALGRPSNDEWDGPSAIAQLQDEIDRIVNGFLGCAINQSIRAGFGYARVFRVGRMAALFAASQGWSPQQTDLVGLAAKLIDVGMMIVPDELLNKPHLLSDGERRLIAEHARFGAELLSNSRLAVIETCAPIVRFHHERWDGGGPAGLERKNIPPEARLVALCDCFDALTHARPWRTAFAPAAAMQLIRQDAGKHFDPALAEAFLGWLEEESSRAPDVDAHFACEADDNEYVRTRKRLERLIRDNG
jgi:putative two-component system response regulator